MLISPFGGGSQWYDMAIRQTEIMLLSVHHYGDHLNSFVGPDEVGFLFGLFDLLGA